jgi:ABC-type sugar transport system permease subunit
MIRIYFKLKYISQALGNNIAFNNHLFGANHWPGFCNLQYYEVQQADKYKMKFFSPSFSHGDDRAGLVVVVSPQQRADQRPAHSSGLVDNPPGWLAVGIAICITAAAAGRQVGYVMVLYLAGLKRRSTLIDARLVDGADRWQLFRHIILPLLASDHYSVHCLGDRSLRSFDLVR